LDSVVLAHLLVEAGYTFTLAHCNFGLRGKESDRDEQFCSALAKKLGVGFVAKRMSTKEYAKRQKISIQMAARDLRYQWFGKLMNEKGWSVLLTAHHLNDDIETMLLNLARGTGLAGLKGMEMLKNRHARPLLPFSRIELEQYARKNKIKYRIDQSNYDQKYQRNFIRLSVLPSLQKMNPSLERTLKTEMNYFKDSYKLQEEVLSKWIKKHVKSFSEGWEVKKSDLQKCKWKGLVLHKVLNEVGFTSAQIDSVAELLERKANSGKIFIAKPYLLSVEQDLLRLNLKRIKDKKEVFPDWESLNQSRHFKITDIAAFRVPNNDALLMKKADLRFPIIWRNWKNGDRLVPFGMRGSKLISDLLKEARVGVVEREHMKVLENGNGDILWLAGIRSHEHYRVNKEDRELILIKRIER
jgi:tRNA(Ile)-lysidine synthase